MTLKLSVFILCVFFMNRPFGALAETKKESPFIVGCDLPFKSIAKKHHIDDFCPAQGTPKNESAALQNAVKSNFCANEKPLPITLKDFVTLQEKADEKHIAHGRNHLPQDRKELKNLVQINGEKYGEGKVVQFTGFLISPHYSDVGHGESVNCNVPGPASNDIHMAISDHPVDLPKGKKGKAERNKLLCETVVAEVTPHFRPEAWEEASLKRIAASHTPVRITGQLFYDGSHSPCHQGSPGSHDPARASIWEIHPIYNIEICTNKKLEHCTQDKWKQLKSEFSE